MYRQTYFSDTKVLVLKNVVSGESGTDTPSKPVVNIDRRSWVFRGTLGPGVRRHSPELGEGEFSIL